MTRRSAASYARNRELQRKRNTTSNPNRRRTYGYTDYHVRTLETREFVGWDGEGYTDQSGHHYMLFGCSKERYVAGRDLSTRECLDLVLEIESQDPTVFHVGFAFEYDVNMILRDLEWRYLAILHDVGVVKWQGYRIRHTPHKSFSVSKDGVSATIYDVFGFFHTSYLKALAKFHIGTAGQISAIRSGKENRSNFTYSQIAEVIKYWSEEISLLPPLMDKLRESCYSAGFYITQWHGPGALASFALQKYGVRTWKAMAKNVPSQVKIARQFAYAGGRFQAWKCGLHLRTVYTADINSAYAHAASLLPRLDNGTWKKVDIRDIRSASDIHHFGLYKIAFHVPRDIERTHRHAERPFPLFLRDKHGILTWPAHVENWYWSPEAALVAGSEYAEILEAWVYENDDTRRIEADGSYRGSFSFVQGAFDRRLELQQMGNPAEKAYKWFLASIYGQFAQRVGWDKPSRTAPRSHQLEWAGYITSYCRALVYRAAVDVAKRGGLISIDTDGVTSTVPFNPEKLPGGTGSGLGEWKLESFSGILFWQNGIYWLRDQETGRWVDPKTRGIPRGSIRLSVAACALRTALADRRHASIHITRTRFIGYYQALQNQFGQWRVWKSEPTEITFGGAGKGRHVPAMCPKCAGDKTRVMHSIVHFPPDQVFSEPHKLPWLVKPDMGDLQNVTDSRYLGG